MRLHVLALRPLAVSFAMILAFWTAGQNPLLAAEPDSREKAVREIERLSKAEKIEGSYADMAVAASRVIDPEVNDKALRRQIGEMAKAAARAWDAEDSPEGKIAALSRVVFENYGFSKPQSAAPVVSGKGVRETYLLPGVLNGKRGYCEGLSTVYLLVAKQADLPVSIINLPIHTLCRVDLGDQAMYVECVRNGALCSHRSTETMNGVRAAGKKAGVYLSPLTKKQFLNLHVNALAYGLIQQRGGPKPLEMSQMVRLADAIQRLDPNRPESLETAALIHFKAGNVNRAREIIDRTVRLAEKYGAPSWVLSHYRKMERKYQADTVRAKPQ